MFLVGGEQCLQEKGKGLSISALLWDGLFK